MAKQMSATSIRRWQTYPSAWTPTTSTEGVEFALVAVKIQQASIVRAALLDTTDPLRFVKYGCNSAPYLELIMIKQIKTVLKIFFPV